MRLLENDRIMNGQETPALQPVYLGDSVYASFNGYAIVLTTNNGHDDDPRNHIVIEPEVWRDLLSFVEARRRKVQPVGAGARKIEEVKARHARELAKLGEMICVLNRVPEEIVRKCEVYNEQLDFNNLTREETVAILSALPAGTWTKSVNASLPYLIDYEGVVDGVKVRLWGAAPPESCRVIEVEEVVPATTIKRRKIICSDKEPL